MRVRGLLLVAGLAILLLAEAKSFRRWELKWRILLLSETAGLSVADAEQRGSMYGFDRKFGRFIEGVNSAVPPGSSVEVSLPSTTELYPHTARYALVPRPIFDVRVQSQADFLAVYEPKGVPRARAPWAVPGGTLSRLR